jgi:hypothetical protein
MNRKSIVLVATGFLVCFLVAPSVSIVAVAQKNAVQGEKYALLIGSYELMYQDRFKDNYGKTVSSGGAYTQPCQKCYGQTPYFKDIPFAMKDMLIGEFGWPEDHILLLYQEEATKANIMAGFDWLLSNDEAGNTLLVDWEMHGSFVDQVSVQRDAWFGAIWGDETGVDEMAMAYDSDPYGTHNFVYDDELRYLFGGDDLKGTWIWIFGNCYSAGLGDDFQGKNKVILCADGEHEMTITADPETHMHLFEYYVMKALHGETGANIPYCDLDMNPDSDGNGAVSIEEAFHWTLAALANTDQTIIALGMGPSNPVMFDGVTGETYL